MVRVRYAILRWQPRMWPIVLILCTVASAPAQNQPDKTQVEKAQPQKVQATSETEPAPPDEPDEPTPETPKEEETADLVKIDQMELPSFARLLQGPPIDWIVLTNLKVLEVEPLYPRPGTIDDVNARIKQLMRKTGQPAEKEETRRKRLALYHLPVTLLEGEEREFRLHIRYIKEIIYYEELMLRRIDKLLDERQVRQAYELLVALDQRQGDWPGTVPRRERLLSVEARDQLEAGRAEQALALLEALHERNGAYAGLDEQFGAVFDRLIGDALAAGDPRQARFFLKRLARRLPGHKLVPVWTARLMQQARSALEQATIAERAGQVDGALDRAEQAARLWPELPELLPVFNRLSNPCQRLRVGVVDLAGPDPDPNGARAVFLPSAQRRRRQLTEIPLFQPARVTDKIARFESRFLQDWDPAELGHSVVLRLKPFLAADQSQPLVTAVGLTDALSERLDASSRHFDARLSAAVAGMTVRGPFELAVQFRQVPLRPEALFSFPYRQPIVDASVLVAATQVRPVPPGEKGVVSYPFQRVSGSEANGDRYRRSVPEPERGTDRHVVEVLEVRYDSHEKAIQGALRGEVSYLPKIPVSTIKSLSARNEFFTQPYGLPSTHFLQFHPQSKALRSRALRRSLIYALDRQRMLEEIFLRETAGGLGRVVSAPWATTSYAYNRFVIPHNFDAQLAFALAKTAEKELNAKLPTLRMQIPDDPEIRQSAARIVSAWNRIGVKVTLLPMPQAGGLSIDSPDWDVAYREETIAEPLVELWPLLALTDSTETTTLGNLPTWLRHDLLALDRVGDWRSAEELLHKLHRQLWAEVHLIPLWEIDAHFVVRRNIRNIPERPLFPYQGIEHWKVEPWYPRD